VVVSVTQLVAGTTVNVIPADAALHGTVRALSDSSRTAIKEILDRLARGIAEAHEMAVAVTIEDGDPATVNDEASAEWAVDLARRCFGPDRVTIMRTPGMASEDFSHVLNRVPGAMLFLGTCPPGVDPATAAGNHSSCMIIDEDAMATGIAMYAQLALQTLA
jgi:hippurate hydrolase